MTGVVEEGSRIVLDVNGDKQLFITVKGKNTVKLGKSFYPVRPLIGLPYGATVGVAADGKTLQQVPPAIIADWQEGAALEVTRNNMNLVDLGEANQQMTTEEIEELRHKGAGGTAIVEALAAQSITFGTKTEFSQAKYKKKKARKYVVMAVVRRPTAVVIAEAYYARQAARIGHLRADTLSLLLSLANVAAHARVLVVDTCAGLMMGAAAERLGGTGSVVGVRFGADRPSREALLQFADAGVRSVVCECTLDELLAEQRRAEQRVEEVAEAVTAVSASAAAPVEVATGNGKPTADEPTAEVMQVDMEQRDGSADVLAAPVAIDGSGMVCLAVESDGIPLLSTTTDEEAAPIPAESVPAHRPAAADATITNPNDHSTTANMEQHRLPFDSCIIAAPGLDPLATLSVVAPLLAPSTPFAIYSPWSGALAAALASLRTSRSAVNLALQESWWREAQVLPGRTHPTMSMDHGGGYVLSGTVVLP